jgi:twitching motility protein PilT
MEKNKIEENAKKKIKQMLSYFLGSKDASDLYIRENPAMRNGGKIVKIDGVQKLSEEELQEVIKELLRWRYSDDTSVELFFKKAMFENEEVDIAVKLPGTNLRARVNIYKSMGVLGTVLRKIPTEIPKFNKLGFYEINDIAIKNAISKREGLVLVTGQTGTGKSTTLASIIDYLNETQSKHIITVEDPVEFTHQEKKCIVTQREVGNNADTKTFADGLRASLREAPDIILVGEMRDAETATAAMNAAQTGHLVFATLHTNSAPETVLRIIDMFPADKEKSVKVALASSLLMVISQKLVPDINGKRSLCYEIMQNNTAIKNIIINESSPESKILNKMVETMKDGSIPLNHLLNKRINDGLISIERALEFSNDRDALESLLKTANKAKQGDVNSGGNNSNSKKSFLS